MLSFLENFTDNTWALIAEMAPYLLFGFAVAGLLHSLIRKEQVQRLLGKPGLSSVIKACLIGVPMPLCSCSVIPVAASLRKSGASRGATAAFLSSTPQTGVDSILATYGLLGGAFTAIRVAVAFISGVVSGFLIELLCAHKNAPATDAPKFTLVQPESGSFTRTKLQPIQPTAQTPNLQSCCSQPAEKETRSFSQALRYGFVTLPADLAAALIVGLVLAGLITTLMPDDLIQGAFSSGVLSFLLATLISLPLYVCATASIPMAYALMAAGLSPGAALVFLIAGPATNTATIAAIWHMLGRKATCIYLGSLLVISWLAGWAFNVALSDSPAMDQIHQHAATHLVWWQHAAGIFLILLLLYARRPRWPSKAGLKSCCAK
jgi:uncharacterized membrane protein YraQ (UPF0718 family)